MIYQQTAPVAGVTVQELKHHLQIDYDNDDGLLEAYALAATQQAEHIMQREIVQRKDPLALSVDKNSVPAMVKQFILLATADFYRYRENVQTASVNRIFVHLLDPFILYNRSPCDDAEAAPPTDDEGKESGDGADQARSR